MIPRDRDVLVLGAVSSDSVLATLRASGNVYVLVGTIASIAALDPAAYSGCSAFATDLGKSGIPVRSDGTGWRIRGGSYVNLLNNTALRKYIVAGCSGATYSQVGTTVTVTWATHLFTAAVHNGANIYLPAGTGALLSGWFSDVTYVDATTFTCTSTVSQTTSGNLGTNSSETMLAAIMTLPDTIVYAGSQCSPSVLITAKTGGSTKTLKGYCGDVQTNSVSVSGSNASTGLGTMVWMSPTTFVLTASGTVNTPSSKVLTPSLTVAAADWAMATYTVVQFVGG